MKARKALDSLVLPVIDFIAPNLFEMQALATAVTGVEWSVHPNNVVESVHAMIAAVRGWKSLYVHAWAELNRGILNDFFSPSPLLKTYSFSLSLLSTLSFPVCSSQTLQSFDTLGLRSLPTFIVKMGPDGVLAPRSLNDPRHFMHYPVRGKGQPQPMVVSVTGAGDRYEFKPDDVVRCRSRADSGVHTHPKVCQRTQVVQYCSSL